MGTLGYRLKACAEQRYGLVVMDTPRPDGPPDRLVARRFDLVDPTGRIRAVLGHVDAANEPWSPQLVLFDEHGDARVFLVVGPHGPSLSLLASGNTVAEVGVTDPGPNVLAPGPHVLLAAANGAPRLMARVDRDGRLRVTRRRRGVGRLASWVTGRLRRSHR